MIQKINNFLLPLENWLYKNQKIIAYTLLGVFAIIFIAICFQYGLQVSEKSPLMMQIRSGTLLLAKISSFLLLIILWIPIFSRVFGIKVFQPLIALRKELGIIMGIFALPHAIFILQNYETYFAISSALTVSGLIAQSIIFLLLITSNEFSRKKMWKNWKRLHRLVYVAYIALVIQLFIVSGQQNYLIIVAAVVYFLFKILEWKNIKFYTEEKKVYPKGQKWLCVPCGYIYDPVVGDVEDGIAPGTEFSDIPDDWRCPDCGVTKADFIPYNEGELQSTPVKIISKKYLNPTTIELTISVSTSEKSKIGQFATFEYTDENGTFRRQYSVAKHENDLVTFLIKIHENGRGGKILTALQEGENMNFVGFFGDFLLQETQNPKIFIATGTGLAPIYRMMNASKDIPKKLYFSVSTADETFYKEELEKIPNLEIFAYVSREKVDGYLEGRIQFSDIKAENNVEWYLCGNPKMLEDFIEKIEATGTQKLYYEKF